MCLKLLLPLLYSILLCFHSIAQPTDTLVIRPDGSQGKDAYLRSLTPNSNYGSHSDFSAHQWTFGGATVTVRGIMDINLTCLPEDATIIAAFLSLYTYQSNRNGNHSTRGGPNDALLQRVTQNWDEYTVTWNNQPATTTQNQVILPASVSLTQHYENIDITDMMRDMANDRMNSHGILFKQIQEQLYQRMIFGSSDNTDPSLRPKVTIIYSSKQPSCIQELYLCKGDSAFLHGAYQTKEGFYRDTLLSSLGYDSIIVTQLIEAPAYSSSQQATICSGDSLFLEGNFQTQAGIYHDTLTSIYGCDSVIVTQLVEIPTYSVSQQASICTGDSLFLEGKHQTQAGIYRDTLTSIYGCDSVIVTNLVLMPLPNIQTIHDTTICKNTSIDLQATGGISYEWGQGLGAGREHTVNPSTTTIYYVSGIDINGCLNIDSVTISTINCDSSYLEIPNVFTPNGDGVNDLFLINGNNIASIEGRILNRWGQELFYWNTFESGWDGQTPSGMSPTGTYYYIIDAYGTDGQVYHKTGSLHLIQ